MGTLGMSAEAVGAYIRLLCYQWDNGAVPDSDDFIMRCGGIANPHAVAEVRLKFGKTTEGLKNSRLEDVRAKQADYRQKQAINGAKRWVGNAKPMPSHMPNACSPSPTPSPTPNKTLGAVAPPTSDTEWLSMLAINTAYFGIDVKREYAKAGSWCEANKKQLTRRRFVNWLNRAERPMSADLVKPKPTQAEIDAEQARLMAMVKAQPDPFAKFKT